MGKQNKRIIGLQRALKIAKRALSRIAFNDCGASSIASEALENIEREELQLRPTPLAGLVGHTQ